MRVVFGILSLLFAVTVIGLLAKKQLGALSGEVTTAKTPAAASLPMITSQQESQLLHSQVKKSVDAASAAGGG